MKHVRSLLAVATMGFLAQGCSDGPTAPNQVPLRTTIEAPKGGPSFTVAAGSLTVGSTPPGGVTLAESGDFSDLDGEGRRYDYSDIQDTLFSFLAWGPSSVGGVSVELNAQTNFLSFQSTNGNSAVWTGSVTAFINNSLVPVPVRVTVFRDGMIPAGTAPADEVPLGTGTVYQVGAELLG